MRQPFQDPIVTDLGILGQRLIHFGSYLSLVCDKLIVNQFDRRDHFQIPTGINDVVHQGPVVAPGEHIIIDHFTELVAILRNEVHHGQSPYLPLSLESERVRRERTLMGRPPIPLLNPTQVF